MDDSHRLVELKLVNAGDCKEYIQNQVREALK